MSSIKKWVASVALASTVVGGGLTIAAVGLPTLAGAQGNEATANAPHGNGKVKAEILAHRKDILNGVAEVIGIDPDALKAELKAGKSLAEVAQAHGKTTDQLVAGLLARAKNRVDEAVANGKITAEQGQKILDRLAERLPTIVERSRPADHPGGRGVRPAK